MILVLVVWMAPAAPSRISRFTWGCCARPYPAHAVHLEPSVDMASEARSATEPGLSTARGSLALADQATAHGTERRLATSNVGLSTASELHAGAA